MAIPKLWAPVLLTWSLFLAACPEEAPPLAKPVKQPLGKACTVASECESNGCADSVCVTMPRQIGESCSVASQCREGLVCHRSGQTGRKTYQDENYNPSVSYGDLCQDPEKIPEIEARKQREADRAMLKSSGLSDREVAEKMAVVEAPSEVATGPGLPVRVVRTEAKIGVTHGTVIAACKDTERLVSGSCGLEHGSKALQIREGDLETGVTGYSATDTVGARWTCVGGYGDTVVAKALCQALPPAKP